MRAVFTVTAKGTRWSIAHDGRVLSTHASKDTAVMKARKYAIKHAPSNLIVHGIDKAQEFEWRYD